MFDRRQTAGRASRRRLSGVTGRIERSAVYRHSLKQVLALVEEFQSSLDVQQRERWLTLEEALLEHVSQLNQQYFYAGVEHGRRTGKPRPADRSASSPTTRRSHPRADSRGRLAEADLIVALAQLIRELAER
jgi:hypothetical protein